MALKLLEKELNENNDKNRYKFYHSIILILQSSTFLILIFIHQHGLGS